jgi:regulatory protein YycI of two-component signal transduction system YycFG
MLRGLAIIRIVVHFLLIVFLGGFLIDWKTKKHIVVSHSSAEAELRAIALLTAKVTLLRRLLENFAISATALAPLFSDSTKA